MIQNFRQYMWMSLSLIRNLKRRKFKAILRPIYDSRYRRDLQRMRRVIGHGRYELKLTKVQLCTIHSSHAINYPKWVKVLSDRILNYRDYRYTPPPIKVIFDEERSSQGHLSYLVIDGNHRLMAMKHTMSPGQMITVYEMVRV